MGKFLRGVRPGGPSTSYGYTPDAGEIDDPLIIGTTYSTTVLYVEGNCVTPDSGTTYYYCLKANFNVPLSNTSYWFQANRFFYFDDINGNDANIGSTNPTTAKAAPLKTAQRIADYMDTNGGTYQASNGDVFLGIRGGMFTGGFYFLRRYYMGCYGTPANARPQVNFDNNTSRYQTGQTIEYMSGSDGSVCRNWKINPRFTTVYTYTGSTTLVDGDRVQLITTGLKPGTVVGTPANLRICIILDSASTRYSNNDVIETVGGAKTCTLAANTNTSILGGIACTTSQNSRMTNLEVYNACGNGIGSGFTGTRTSANGLTIKNCFVHDTCKWGATGAGIQGGWGSGIKLLNNTGKDNGVNFNGVHQFYLDDMDNAEIAYNHAYCTALYGNHAFVVHGECTNVDMHDNKADSCQNGIGINEGYGGAWYEAFTNWNVYRNIISNNGNAFGGSGLVFDLQCLVNTRIYSNIAYNNAYVVNIHQYNTASNAIINNLTLAFNTLVSDATTGGDYFIKLTGVTNLGIKISSNIFVTNAAGLATVSKDVAIADAEVTLNNNLIWNPNNSNVIRWNGTTYTVVTFSGAPNGNASNIRSDPLFNTGTNVYTLQIGSPARLLGLPIAGISTDFLGKLRSSSTPSAGCYE